MLRPSTVVITITTVILWAMVLLTGLIAGFGQGIISFALVVAIGGTVALWLVWAFMNLDEMSKARQFEKDKRTASAPGDDARLSVLLSLMDDDERRSLRQRLRDEMSGDGESIALDDLLTDKRSRR